VPSRPIVHLRPAQGRAELARIQHEVRSGTYVRPLPVAHCRGVPEQWREFKAGKKPSTVRCYDDSLKPVIDRYGKLPQQALDTTRLETIKGAMLFGEARRRDTPGKPLSARAVNLTLTVTGMALRAAVRHGLGSSGCAGRTSTWTTARWRSARTAHAPRPETHSDTFARLVRRADLPPIPVHGARHCAASLLADLGYPVVIVAA
jgi:hypothetical protein